MRTTCMKRAIRNAFFRLGLHTTPKEVVSALREQDIQVDEQLVRAVRFEMLKEEAEEKVARMRRPVPPRAVRRRPQGFPGRRGK